MANHRGYTNAQLTAAVGGSTSWASVLRCLGMSPNGNAKWVKKTAAAIGLDTSHFLNHLEPVPSAASLFTGRRRAKGCSGLSVACRWFLDRGYPVSVPLEPAPYDLIAESDGGLKKVQVKTTTRADRSSGRLMVNITHKIYDASLAGNASGRRRDVRYMAEEVDLFFIVAGESVYLIPLEVVASQANLTLDSRYAAFRADLVPTAGFEPATSPSGAARSVP